MRSVLGEQPSRYTDSREGIFWCGRVYGGAMEKAYKHGEAYKRIKIEIKVCIRKQGEETKSLYIDKSSHEVKK